MHYKPLVIDFVLYAFVLFLTQVLHARPLVTNFLGPNIIFWALS